MPALDLSDGFTRTATVEPIEGYPLTVTYRPALFPAVSDWQQGTSTGRAADATAKLLVAHLVSWDATQDGKPAPITAATINKLPSAYVSELVALLLNWKPGEAELGK